jgi:hypothetical protein
MQSTRVGGGAQIEVVQAADARTVRVTVRVSRQSAGDEQADLVDPDNAVFDWARTSLAAEILAIVESRLKLFPLGLAEQLAIDQESGEPVLCWDSAKLMTMLPEDVPELLRAPVPAPEAARPQPRVIKEPDSELALRTAQRVAYLKSELLASGQGKRRSVRTMACEIVARESGRTWEAVSKAERRGRRHSRFSERTLPDSAREPLQPWRDATAAA